MGIRINNGGFSNNISNNIFSFSITENNIFKEKNFDLKNNLWINFSTILLIYLGVRGIFENSFSVFGIDYVFLILAYFETRDFTKSTS
jgi:hypothetical protein